MTILRNNRRTIGFSYDKNEKILLCGNLMYLSNFIFQCAMRTIQLL